MAKKYLNWSLAITVIFAGCSGNIVINDDMVFTYDANPS